MKSPLFVLLLSFISFPVWGYDFYWTGNYSLEGQHINGVDLSNASKGDKTYLNHHLLLKPEVVLFEGLSVKGVLDVLNSGDSSLPNSQRVGHIIGGGLSSSAPGSAQLDEPAVFQNRAFQKTRDINLTEAYFEFSHVKGQLIIGRFPLHFGFGAFYNKGHQPFDHWYTTRDGLAYEFNLASLDFKPMVMVLNDPLTSDDPVFEYGLEFHFRVPDTGLDLGAMILGRRVAANSNSPAVYGVTGSADTLNYSLFYKRTKKTYSYGAEALFQTGSVGSNSTGDEVSLKGMALAFEGEAQFGRWDVSAKAGWASGDDPTNVGSFSGVSFHRNYNLGFILFNHPLGVVGQDITQTALRGKYGSASASSYESAKMADTDRISNAMYFAPTFTYNFSSSWALGASVVSAWLNETTQASGENVSSYIGSELDLKLNYNPTKNISFFTELGVFAPGAAFEGTASQSFKSKTVIGLRTGLSVNF